MAYAALPLLLVSFTIIKTLTFDLGQILVVLVLLITGLVLALVSDIVKPLSDLISIAFQLSSRLADKLLSELALLRCNEHMYC
jgi:hypothetical protein